MKAKSFELWRGPSSLDDAPVVVIASGVGVPSLNPKTGPVIQVYFLRADVSPCDAVTAKDTRSICGECVHAPHRDGTCYVNAAFGAHQLWLSWRRGDCPPLSREVWGRRFAGRFLRLGAYGDPASAPDDVSIAVVGAAEGHTGYTHAWRDRPLLRSVCMASVTGEADRLEAEAMGWRAFRVVPMNPDTHEYLELVPKDLATCGASVERGKRVTCIDCQACGGLSSKARASIVIGAHGTAHIRFAGVRGLGRDASRYASATMPEALPADSEWGFVP